MTKFREFYIDNSKETLGNFFLYNVQRGVMNYAFKGAIHVIEYAALEAERERSKKLVEALANIQAEASKGDGTTTECEMACLADEALKSYKEGAE